MKHNLLTGVSEGEEWKKERSSRSMSNTVENPVENYFWKMSDPE
jgi:hypothetical protein